MGLTAGWGALLGRVALASFLLASWPDAASAADASPTTDSAIPAWKKLPRSQGPAPKTVCTSSSATAADYSGASDRIDPEQAQSAGVRFWTGSVGQIIDVVGGAPPPDRVLTGAPTGDAGPGGSQAACSGYLADWASVEAKRKADLVVLRQQQLSKANRTRQLVVSPNLDQLLKLTVRTGP